MNTRFRPRLAPAVEKVALGHVLLAARVLLQPSESVRLGRCYSLAHTSLPLCTTDCSPLTAHRSQLSALVTDCPHLTTSRDPLITSYDPLTTSFNPLTTLSGPSAHLPVVFERLHAVVWVDVILALLHLKDEVQLARHRHVVAPVEALFGLATVQLQHQSPELVDGRLHRL